MYTDTYALSCSTFLPTSPGTIANYILNNVPMTQFWMQSIINNSKICSCNKKDLIKTMTYCDNFFIKYYFHK